MTVTIPPGYVLGADGKAYPARSVPDATRARIVGRVHYLSHDLHLSVRKIVARLAEGGYRASVGTVHAWLTTWTCERCSGGKSFHLNSSDVQVSDSAAPEQSAGVSA